jgi:DNA-binding transcriptional LysR family regulator
LERHGMIYRLAFTSPDVHSALAAGAAGIGILSLPREFVPSSLTIAGDYYLPRLKPIRLQLAVRSGIQSRHSEIVDRLSRHLFRRVSAEVINS